LHRESLVLLGSQLCSCVRQEGSRSFVVLYNWTQCVFSEDKDETGGEENAGRRASYFVIYSSKNNMLERLS
jgi:hypothetical protein